MVARERLGRGRAGRERRARSGALTADLDGAGHPQRWRILAILCLSLVLVVLAVSSLNTAIPRLQRGLDSSATELLWIVDAYALVFAGTLLPAGALGDRFGRKGALITGRPHPAR